MNENKAVETAKKQKDSFQSSLSEGFRSKIKKEVVTMKTPKETKEKSSGNI